MMLPSDEECLMADYKDRLAAAKRCPNLECGRCITCLKEELKAYYVRCKKIEKKYEAAEEKLKQLQYKMGDIYQQIHENVSSDRELSVDAREWLNALIMAYDTEGLKSELMRTSHAELLEYTMINHYCPYIAQLDRATACKVCSLIASAKALQS